MNHLLYRIEVYGRYLLEYVLYGEFRSLLNAIHFMITRTSKAKGGIVKSRLGLFETRPQSLDFQHVNYAYEIKVKKFIEGEDFNIFFDIGACLGEFSIWMAGKGKKCFAFEPVKYSYEMIERNIRLNNVQQNITLFKCGLGSKQAEVHFELNETNPGSNRRVDLASKNTEMFVVNTLDDLMPRFGLSPNDRILIKIDVEGMELEMLSGAKEFINKFDNIVMIIEEKFSGEDNIRKGLLKLGNFEFGQIDEHNIYARKINSRSNFS